MRYLSLLFVLLFTFACQSAQEGASEAIETSVSTVTEAAAMQPDSILRHAVYFAYNDDTTPAQIEEIETAFAKLPSQIDGIEGFEMGVNSSPEGINKGLTHAYLLTFHSDAARDAYLPHPAHKAFGEIVGPHLKDVTVIDYWTKG
ncbi:MAG: Dabb family protein [Saprospiraceae bacterium]